MESYGVTIESPSFVQIYTARSAETLMRGDYDIDERARYEMFGGPYAAPEKPHLLGPGQTLDVRPWVAVLVDFARGGEAVEPGGVYYLQVRGDHKTRSNVFRFEIPLKPRFEREGPCEDQGPR
jgi:hypothetical protein